MSGFKKHMRAGTKAYAGLPPVVLLVHLIGDDTSVLLATAAVALPFTLVGAMFPDLDAQQSIPFRYFRQAVAITTSAIVAAVLYANRSYVIAIGEILPLTTSAAFIGGVIYGTTVIAVGWVIFRFVYVYNPSHRGVLHQIPAGIVITSIIFSIFLSATVLLSIPQPTVVTTFVSLGFFVGYLSHLYLDRDPHSGKSLLLLRKTYIGARLDNKLN